jgi:serine/threonine protein kinase
MSKQFGCVRGHRWELDTSKPGSELLGVACPVCGSAAESWPPVSSGEGDGGRLGRDALPRIPGYEVLGRLGAGGMGVVYKARQLRPDRLVAVKRMKPPDPGSEVEHLQRFRLEAEAAARLRHPGIVEIYEVGEHEGCPFFSMELIEGGSLDARLKGGPLPPRQAAELIEKAARAIHAAHQAGIIHRDLKPANVLLAGAAKESSPSTGAGGAPLPSGPVTNETPEPRISDFGLAKQLDVGACTQTGAFLGTPAYAAPEQARGRNREVGVPADVYALGAILYECLTGRPPFNDPDPMETLLQVIAAEPVSPRALQPKVPRDLETICHKCLAKEAARRYPSARELADDLRRFLDHEPIRARPVGSVGRAWRWCRRNPSLAGALTAVLLVFATGATASVTFGVLASHRAADAKEARDEAEGEARRATESEKKALSTGESLRKANEELTTFAARTLLKPMGLRAPLDQAIPKLPPLSEPEIDPLWELASADDKVRIRFVEEGLRQRMTTRQLQVRAEYALHAAAGLDPKRRERIEQLLADRLWADQITPEERLDVALILARFGIQDPTTAAKAAAVLAAALDDTTDDDARVRLASALAATSERLQPKDAARLGGKAAEALAAALDKSRTEDARARLASALVAVSVRLVPKWPALLCHKLVAAMSQPNREMALRHLAEMLKVVADRLEPDDAIAIADAFVVALRHAAGEYALAALVKGLTVVSARLEREQALPKFRKAASALLSAVRDTADASALRHLATSLAAVSEALGPKEAALICGKAADVLVAALETGPQLEALAKGLAALSARLGPAEAARVCGKAASALSVALDRTKDDFARGDLSEGLAAVSHRLEPKEAKAAATALSAALSDAKDTSFSLSSMAKALAAVSPRLGTKEAALARRAAADALVVAMSNETEPTSLWHLEWGLEAVAARLAPKEAAEVADALASAMSKTASDAQRWYLAKGVTISGQRAPKEAAPAFARAAAVILPALSEATSGTRRGYLAAALAAISPGLGASDAARARDVILTLLNTTDEITLACLAEGLAALSARLGPKEASAACSKAESALSAALCRTTKGDFEVQHLSDALVAVSRWLEPNEAGHAAGGAILLRMSKIETPTSLELARVLAPLRPQLLVELLKHPLCVGDARRAVLAQLSRHYDRPFADQWDFVRYATDKNLDLDLLSPPRRPEPR